MDQRIFNGVGNYLRAEILHVARLPPFVSCRHALQLAAAAHPLLASGGEAGPSAAATPATTAAAAAAAAAPRHASPPDLLTATRDTLAAAVAKKGTDWLQVYRKRYAKQALDGMGRTVWFRGERGPLPPSSSEVRRPVMHPPSHLQSRTQPPGAFASNPRPPGQVAGDFDARRPPTSLFVARLPPRLQRAAFETICAQFGALEKLMFNERRRYALVRYAPPDAAAAATRAVRALNGATLLGCRVVAHYKRRMSRRGAGKAVAGGQGEPAQGSGHGAEATAKEEEEEEEEGVEDEDEEDEGEEMEAEEMEGDEMEGEEDLCAAAEGEAAPSDEPEREGEDDEDEDEDEDIWEPAVSAGEPVAAPTPSPPVSVAPAARQQASEARTTSVFDRSVRMFRSAAELSAAAGPVGGTQAEPEPGSLAALARAYNTLSAQRLQS